MNTATYKIMYVWAVIIKIIGPGFLVIVSVHTFVLQWVMFWPKQKNIM